MHLCPSIVFCISLCRAYYARCFLWLAFLDIYTPNGASFFFIVVYLQHVSCLYYASYSIYDLDICYALGVIIFFFMIYNCLFSYVLPWGQMFILGCNSHLPICFHNSGIGEKLVTLLWGGYFVSQTALKSFFCILISFYHLF